MMPGPIHTGIIQAAKALQNWPYACACRICEQFATDGTLYGERERGGMAVKELSPALSALHCDCGPSVVAVWTEYIKGYITAVYQN